MRTYTRRAPSTSTYARPTPSTARLFTQFGPIRSYAISMVDVRRLLPETTIRSWEHLRSLHEAVGLLRERYDAYIASGGVHVSQKGSYCLTSLSEIRAITGREILSVQQLCDTPDSKAERVVHHKITEVRKLPPPPEPVVVVVRTPEELAIIERRRFYLNKSRAFKKP